MSVEDLKQLWLQALRTLCKDKKLAMIEESATSKYWLKTMLYTNIYSTMVQDIFKKVTDDEMADVVTNFINDIKFRIINLNVCANGNDNYEDFDLESEDVNLLDKMSELEEGNKNYISDYCHSIIDDNYVVTVDTDITIATLYALRLSVHKLCLWLENRDVYNATISNFNLAMQQHQFAIQIDVLEDMANVYNVLLGFDVPSIITYIGIIQGLELV